MQVIKVSFNFQGIKSLINDFHTRNQPLIFYNLKPSVVEIFRGVQPKEFKSCNCPVMLDAMLQQGNNDNNKISTITEIYCNGKK